MINYLNKVIQEDLVDIYNSKLNFDALKNKKILITGATGMLATYIVYFLYYLNTEKNKNITIYALVRNKNKAELLFKEFLGDKNFIIVDQDICDEIKIDDDIDLILHLASSANPNTILNNQIGIIKANTIGTLNVFEFAKKNNSKVFFSSTREIYGKVENNDYINEDDMGICNCLEERACYPESKRISETICKSYQLQYGINYQIARIAHVYGPGMNIENDGRIMSDIISDIVNGRNIVLKSTGEVLRSFCYISDAIVGILTILLNGQENEVYNLSNEIEEISIKDLAKLCINLFLEKELKIEYKISKSNRGYTKYRRVGLDNSKLNNLGWKIRINLKRGILKTIKSFQY